MDWNEVRARSKHLSRARILLVIAIALFVVAAIVFGVLFCTDTPSENSKFSSEGTEAGEADWQALSETLPAACAWVSIPDTAIDQPVVLAPVDDPSYYLSHDAAGEASEYGAVFVDADCAEGLASRNVVISAHNMGLGSTAMFGDLAKYADAEYAANHRTVILQESDGTTRTLRIDAVRVVDADAEEKVTSFADDSAFEAYWNGQIEKADVRLCERGEAAPSRMWTFSTCSYTGLSPNERVLVFAREAPVTDVG